MGGFIIEILISLIVLIIMFITSILLKPNIKILLKSFYKIFK